MIRSDSGSYESVASNIAGTAVATSNVRLVRFYCITKALFKTRVCHIVFLLISPLCPIVIL